MWSSKVKRKYCATLQYHLGLLYVLCCGQIESSRLGSVPPPRYISLSSSRLPWWLMTPHTARVCLLHATLNSVERKKYEFAEHLNLKRFKCFLREKVSLNGQKYSGEFNLRFLELAVRTMTSGNMCVMYIVKSIKWIEWLIRFEIKKYSAK